MLVSVSNSVVWESVEKEHDIKKRTGGQKYTSSPVSLDAILMLALQQVLASKLGDDFNLKLMLEGEGGCV